MVSPWEDLARAVAAREQSLPLSYDISPGGPGKGNEEDVEGKEDVR